MSKLLTVLVHTYKSRLKTKAFIITTAISLLLVVGLTNMQTIMGYFEGDEQRTVAVLDKSGELYEPFAQQFAVTKSEDTKIVQTDQSEQELAASVQDGEYDGMLVLQMNEQNVPNATFKAETVSSSDWIGALERSLQQTKVVIATKKLGVDPAEVVKIYEPVQFEKVALKESAKTEEELNQARSVVYVLLFLIYFSVIFYGSMIATEVATEKSSRVMEILISSVSPVKQMFGKIFGIAFLGLTQFILIFLVAFISVKSAPESESGGSMNNFSDFIQLDQLPFSIIIYALVFFFLGFMLYATLLAMLGSLVNKVEEANQVITPVMLIIVIAFMIAMSGLGTPDATFVTVTSYIPFFTPMIMFLRAGMLNIPLWEVLLGITILIASIGLFAVIAAKVYRGGVLMYGSATSLKNLKKALALSKK
ncbi:ABC transporter permease [Alkalihalobacillus sp. AL-G]|uniref:ABC transporter permease n=1 Tax=Alkalihalobacillus sp. AL-G TaxID=2926399 RepID=UPI00272AB5BB|nr:ABC transporter permease [Alkalihalobacillus sp. AL-G]WLD94063.1 ABC transporter permease [Alkalihalobacillus sp. AL-G]